MDGRYLHAIYPGFRRRRAIRLSELIITSDGLYVLFDWRGRPFVPNIWGLMVNTTMETPTKHLEEVANRLWDEKRFSDAERAHAELLRKRPTWGLGLCRMGQIRQRQGDAAGATDFFERAVAANSNLAAAHIGLARIAEQAGNVSDALKHYRNALAASPRPKGITGNIQKLNRRLFAQRLKRANQLIENGKLSEAESELQALLSLDTDIAQVLGGLGRIRRRQGRLEEVLDYYERAIAADPGYEWGHLGRAELLEAKGELPEAIDGLSSALERFPNMVNIRKRLDELKRKQRLLAQRASGVQILNWPSDVVAKLPRLERADHSVAIVSWDLAHNPVGRALVLAELAQQHATCELVGPIHPSYGEDLWTPLRESRPSIDIRGYRASNFPSFLEGAIRMVAERPHDIAWVCKPRLPGLLIGLLYKIIHGAALVVDIDDNELAFVKADAPLSLDEFLASHSPADWDAPHAKRWTQLAASMIPLADAITVCNPVLQARHGGVIVRHARNAASFEAARARRGELRAAFGFAPKDKVILFLGTPRRHKGVLEVARALEHIGDPDAVLCVIGTTPDKTLLDDFARLASARFVFHPDQPYSRLAELNAMADVVCILQNPSDPIALSQTPAKLTDALATGTAIIATPLPPIADMIEPGRIVCADSENFVGVLRDVLAGGFKDPHAAEVRRNFFRQELSVDAHAQKVREILTLARKRKRPVTSDVVRLVRHIDQHMPGSLPQDCLAVAKGAFRRGPRIGKLTSLRKNVNLVFFWKQNDSGIYGRRQDMLLRQFAAMPNIRRILHIDQPISLDVLNRMVPSTSGLAPQQGRLVAANTLQRFLGTLDEEKIKRRVFVYRGRDTQLLGRELPLSEIYPNIVEAWLQELDMTENVLAWVCPAVRGFPEVQRRLGFSFIAADVIDDQRQWPLTPGSRAELESNYRDIFASASVSFANCAPVSQWLKTEGLDPLLVPNGVDIRRDVGDWKTPSRLAALPRPIVGYCGNQANRIDWSLLDAVAAARPGWSFVLIGQPSIEEASFGVLSRPNVHVFGVMPYEIALRHVAAFDVGIIPHTRTELSLHMNPLKLYVYRGLGIPVVSTDVANLDDFANDMRVASDAAQFVAALESAIAERGAEGRIFPSEDVMLACSWESRAATIMAWMETALERQSGSLREIAA
jgi:tetratricopeptide (TPR) repeat protein